MRSPGGMMRRSVLALAVLAVLTAACGTADEPAATRDDAPTSREAEQQAQATTTPGESQEQSPPTHPDPEDDATDAAAVVAEPEEPGDKPDAEEPSGVGTARAPKPADSRGQPPEFASGQTPADYLEELVASTMTDAEGGVSEDAAQPDRVFTRCVSESFVSVFDEDRLGEMALVLSQTEDLWGPLPYDLVTPAEMQRWTEAAHPCIGASVGYAVDSTDLLREMVTEMLSDQSEEALARLEAGLNECLSALAGDRDFTSALLQNLVFDVPGDYYAEAQHAGFMFDLCGESLMEPLLVETLVAEEGMQRTVAVCAAPAMLDMARYELAMFTPDAQPPADDQVEAMFEFLAVLADCGLDTEDLFGIDGGGEQREQDSASQEPDPVADPTTSVPVCCDHLAPFEGQEPDPAIGQPAPAFAATTFDGVEAIVQPGDGTAKVIVFFAHWCPHCQRELPRIADWLVANQLPAGVEVIAVSTAVDPAGPNYPPSVWFEEEQWPAAVVRDSAQNEIAEAYGLRTYPYTVAIDADGTIAARVAGELNDEAWEFLLDFVVPVSGSTS